MLLPAPLVRGDLVRVVAPSGCFDPARFHTGVSLLEAAGLRVAYDDGIFARERYLAGDDARRLRELEAALADREAKALWTARGGYGATRLLPSLPPGPIASRRPWLVGFSDTTALHALWARAGVASLHGANVTTLATWTEEARRELVELLLAPSPATYAGTPLRPGPVARGPLQGGNLTVLGAMAGTGTLPSWQGAIVLVEDIGEKPYRLDRTLTQLLQAGAFAGVRGIVIGQLTGCEEPEPPGYTALEVMTDVLATLGVPILGGLPIGHDPSSRAVLLGALAELDTERGELKVRER